jgi:cytoskeletal protein RodZ
MARSRFSEMLLARRHELGLTVSQASKILKLREDVLVAFEEGDYEHMPQSGYAQGMLSSYARYLGLNAREVVDLFQEELYEHHTGTSSHELRRRTRETQAGRGISGYDIVNEEGSRPKAYVEYRPLLPTAGGPAGDMGDFATTAPARPRTSVPLAGSRGAGAPVRRIYQEGASAPRPYNGADPSQRSAPSTARRRAGTQRRRADAQTGRRPREGRDLDETARSARSYRRDDVSTRRVLPSEYTDDMRYDDPANPYAPASTISGRRSSRNIAQVERPNVRRRGAPSGRGGTSARRGRRPARPRGPLGSVRWFLSDSRRALALIIVLLTAVLTAILVLSVGACVSAKNQGATSGQNVAVNSVDQDASTTDATSTDDASTTDATSTDDASTTDATSTAAADEAATTDASDSATSTPTETVVEVTVADGSFSWLEITCDGTSEIADSVTGPWSASYTVYDSITVQTGTPGSVTVTVNGEPQEFNSKASGIGSLTIKGTPKAEDATTTGDSTDTTTGASPTSADTSSTAAASSSTAATQTTARTTQ